MSGGKSQSSSTSLVSEQHRGVLEGARYRVQKLSQLLNTVRMLPDDDPEKLSGVIFACGLLRDIITNILIALLGEADEEQEGETRPPEATLTIAELDSLEAACRKVPLTEHTYVAEDLVQTLFETVIDYQHHTTTVENAIAHFKNERWWDVRRLSDLEALFTIYRDDELGNTALAQYLWGYRFWTRAQQLRGLVAFFRRQGISDLDGLRAWAASSSFRTFEGEIKGLGPAVYQWLVMRLGVETAKPDVHVLRFVESAIGRRVSEMEAVAGITEAARRLGLQTRVLDWSIWEHQRTGL